MTPDHTDIPDNDAIASAARRALERIAGLQAGDVGPWAAITAGARRVHRRRVATVAASLAIVLAGAGGAAAVAVAGGRGDTRSPHTASAASTTTSTVSSTTAPTTTTAPATTTSVRGGPPATAPTIGATTTTTAGIPVAQAGDLTGTLTLASTTLVAEQSAAVTLTVTNVSGHLVSLAAAGISPGLGVSLDGDATEVTAWAAGDTSPLAAGATRTLLTTVTPPPEMVGPATLSAAFLTGQVMMPGVVVAYTVTGVPSVAVAVVPPNLNAGGPLDPSLGAWNVQMSADAAQVAVGAEVAVHAAVTNVGDQPQNTHGYGSLTIGCGQPGNETFVAGQFLDATTVAPGATQSFTFEFQPVTALPPTVECSVGMSFVDDPTETAPHAALESGTVKITVVDAPSTTTTNSGPGTPPTTGAG